MVGGRGVEDNGPEYNCTRTDPAVGGVNKLAHPSRHLESEDLQRTLQAPGSEPFSSYYKPDSGASIVESTWPVTWIFLAYEHSTSVVLSISSQSEWLFFEKPLETHGILWPE
uniref:Uncharacterized protein n=1 Tax=Ascaris lumbricoides TaxID=6252 RepID=A0A0M3HQH9_ASCLU